MSAYRDLAYFPGLMFMGTLLLSKNRAVLQPPEPAQGPVGSASEGGALGDQLILLGVGLLSHTRSLLSWWSVRSWNSSMDISLSAMRTGLSLDIGGTITSRSATQA